MCPLFMAMMTKGRKVAYVMKRVYHCSRAGGDLIPEGILSMSKVARPRYNKLENRDQ